MRTSHYSIIVAVTIYLKLMVNIILKNNIGGHYLKNLKENIIYKVIHGKDYEKLYKLLFKAHGN